MEGLMAMSSMVTANSTCWTKSEPFGHGWRYFSREGNCVGWVAPTFGEPGALALEAPAKAQGFAPRLSRADEINAALQKQTLDQSTYPPKF
jgi:hypothetical protein